MVADRTFAFAFCTAVMVVVTTGSLVFALRPELIPTLYSVLALYFLPLRVWSYSRKKWVSFGH